VSCGQIVLKRLTLNMPPVVAALQIMALMPHSFFSDAFFCCLNLLSLFIAISVSDD